MRRLSRILWAGATALTLTAGTAAAALVTSEAAMPAPTVVIDFSEFASGGCSQGPGPLQIGTSVGEDIVWTGADSSCLFNGAYALGGNGSWTSGRDGFGALNAASGEAMTYRFNDGPVAAVGGFINYSPDLLGGIARIQVLDATDAVIESYDLETFAPISTPGATDAGAFRGIVRPTADIAAFRVLDQFIAVDNLRFSRTQGVPAMPPATMTALVAMLLAGGVRALRRRSATPAT